MITPKLPKETVEEIDAVLSVLSAELRTKINPFDRAECIGKVNALLDDRLLHMKAIDLEKFGGPAGAVGVEVRP